MTISQEHAVMINMKMFKRYQFYQLFDPNGPTVFGVNVRRSQCVACIAVYVAINVFSALSFLINSDENAVDQIDSLLIMFIYCVNMISILKIVMFLRKADIVWDLFDLARVDFLTSDRCRSNVEILHGYRDTAIMLTDYFLNYMIAVFSLWCAVPLAYNALVSTRGGGDPTSRRQNVFNIMYPVTVAVFNRYFPAFYLMEVVMGMFILYFSVFVDLFLISMCFVITAQYEVLGTAFAGIGHRVDDSASRGDDDENNNNSLIAYQDFKSILCDQILIYKKLESFYSVIWIIVVTLIFVNSVALIILSYSFITIFMSAESFTIYRLLKLPTGYFCFASQIFVYCYVFNQLNHKKESVNFGIYSCNWMKMDLRFQKLLLMAMRMNNANKLMIKTSPTKIVNIQLFAKVMSTTYNIVSVMLNKSSNISSSNK